MEIRMIDGLWRRIDGDKMKSYSTYQKAVEGGKSYEDEPLISVDDAYKHIVKENIIPDKKGRK